jgi:hypothetical protein
MGSHFSASVENSRMVRLWDENTPGDSLRGTSNSFTFPGSPSKGMEAPTSPVNGSFRRDNLRRLASLFAPHENQRYAPSHSCICGTAHISSPAAMQIVPVFLQLCLMKTWSFSFPLFQLTVQKRHAQPHRPITQDHVFFSYAGTSPSGYSGSGRPSTSGSLSSEIPAAPKVCECVAHVIGTRLDLHALHVCIKAHAVKCSQVSKTLKHPCIHTRTCVHI